MEVVTGMVDLCSTAEPPASPIEVSELIAWDSAYDLAVLAVAGTATNTDGDWVSRIARITTSPRVGDELLAIGWGSQSPGGPRECELRREQQTVEERNVCEQAGLAVGAKICVRDSSEDQSGVCEGFSGGPVFASRPEGWALAGLTSTGQGCGPGALGTAAPLADWVTLERGHPSSSG
jgi:hypothetical protein